VAPHEQECRPPVEVVRVSPPSI